MRNHIARDAHCDITMGNDVTRNIHCDVTLSNDIAMCTYYGITMHTDIAINPCGITMPIYVILLWVVWNKN